MADAPQHPDQLRDRVFAVMAFERQFGLVLRVDAGEHGLAAGKLLPVVEVHEIRRVEDEHAAAGEHAIERLEQRPR